MGHLSPAAIRSPWYLARLAGLFGLALALALAGLPVLLGLLSALALVYPPCNEGGATPGDYGLAWEEVTLPARAGGSFRGYFIPGTNGAAVLVIPPLNTGRDGRLREAALLARHGYAVFTFESRRCAGMGGLSLGYKEVDEVADALDYLLARPEVDPARIGVYGFSSAGATAVMAAARLPHLRAVVAEGGYGDFSEGVLGSGSSRGLAGLFEKAYLWSIRRFYRLLTGLEMTVLSPLAVIDRIAPRPVLLIYGSQEVSLPGGRLQAAAAGPNAELWVVPGAGHGSYLDVVPAAYEERLVDFFDKTLGPAS